VAAKEDEIVGAAVLMALIPLVVVLGIAMITLEVQRALGARGHLRQLETRINTLAESSEAGLSWGTTRLKPEMRPHSIRSRSCLSSPSRIVVIGPGIGGLVLRDDITAWYFAGAAADLILVAVVIVVAFRSSPGSASLTTTDDTHSSRPRGG
jgi:hypothetical protein